MNTETTSRAITGSDVRLGNGTIPHDASQGTAVGTAAAAPEAVTAMPLSAQQQVLRRCGADSLETMTAPQLREALDYLLSGGIVPAPLPVLNLPALKPAASEIAAAPSKYEIESDLIKLGTALNDISRDFKRLERNFYLAAFGRYDV